MARSTRTIISVKGVLTAETALHVGGEGASLSQDMPLARNGLGQVFIPGTSFAGPLRNWWENRFGEASARIAFGFTSRKKGEPEGASRIVVYDLPLDVRDDEIEVRDHVTIDRVTGAAADKGKYDRDVIPAGATAGFHIRLESADDDSAGPANTTDPVDLHVCFAAMIKALAQGEIQVGGGKTRGLGRVRLKNIEARVDQPASRLGMLDLLKERNGQPSKPRAFEWQSLSEKAAGEVAPPIRLKIEWTSRLPVFNAGSSPTGAADIAPVISGKGGKQLLLAGSSTKGALRSHSDRIARTVGGGRGAELVDALYGVPGKPKLRNGDDASQQDEAKSTGAKPGLGAVSVADCHVGPKISSSDWQGLDAGGDVDARVRKASQKLSSVEAVRNWRFAEHVSIDRWTGGASDGALFTVLEPDAEQSGYFDISIDLRRLGLETEAPEQRQKLEHAAMLLFFLTLRDMAAGKITFGYGANRGNGSLSIVGISVVSGAIPGLEGAEKIDPKELLDWSFFAKAETLSKAWKAWCEQEIEK